ncbi:ZN679 protein, partial [Psophia crepitans]|nr:ZN679 protein [Psophia crepitans]
LGPNRHACDACGKSFSRDSSLSRHLKIHLGEKPFTCSNCRRSFLCSSTLKDHRTRCPRKPYKCPSCEKRFAST